MLVNHDLSRAVVWWTGWGTAMSPIREDGRLDVEYGDDRAAGFLHQVHSLEEDFYRSTAHLTAPDLRAMGVQAANEFRARHPDISDEAVAALSWCYTYDFK